MALSIPPELKKISAYIRRAEELDKDTGNAESRLVAYYCRQYAVHAGIPLASTSPAAKVCLGELLGALETEKPSMDNFTREEAKFLCKSFADKVFKKADEEDRLGVANKATAKTFYAAATFLQIVDQFCEEGDSEMEEIKKKVVYSKWKSTEILKALKEGRTPAPGGYGEDEEEEEEEENNGQESQEDETMEPSAPKVETVEDDEDDGAGGDLGIPAAPHAPPVPPMEPPVFSEENEEENVEAGTEVAFSPLPPPAYPGESSPDASSTTEAFVALPPPSAPSPPPPSQASIAPPPAYDPPSQSKQKGGGLFGFGKKKAGKVSKAQMEDALELTRFALAALEDKDADLAASRLQQALQSLGH